MTALRQVGCYILIGLYFIQGGRNTATIAWKELRTYLASPGAYIVAAVFPRGHGRPLCKQHQRHIS